MKPEPVSETRLARPASSDPKVFGAANTNTEFVPSPQQEAIFENIRSGSGHAVVVARAGVGKTSTIVAGLNFIPREVPAGGTLLVAFNKSIAAELKTRAPATVDVSTLHSYGLKQVSFNLPRRPAVDAEKLSRVISTLSSDRDVKGALRDFIPLAKANLAHSEAAIDRLLDDTGVIVPGSRSELVALTRAALKACRSDVATVDFDDMIWFPNVFDWGATTYERVFVDECVPGYTPVLLADGTSRPIKELVESKYTGEVLAFDTKTGKQRACKVTNWYTILNQKPLVKIRAKWEPRKGSNRPTNFVVCTTDHKIWANGTWIQAGSLKPGMKVQIETSAEKSQAGKITSTGRVSLATEMSKKNKAGVMVSDSRRGTKLARHRGGNGHGPTVPEKALMAHLGRGWVYQHAIDTKKPRGSAYPTAYKVDIANTSCKVAVEVDGNSHKSRRKLDTKKDKLLRSLGWTVIRVTNQRAVQNAKEEAAKILSLANCPIDAIVTSVEPVSIRDNYVYDLTVEDLHCFYANGILVHNCQDLSKAQMKLALAACKPGGRIMAVGDPAQAIYAFRGADASSIPNLVRDLRATVLPLTVTYRCAKAITRLASTLVPDFECPPRAPLGEVNEMFGYERVVAHARPGDAVLSRTNAALVRLCFAFIRAGVAGVSVQGKDVGGRLLALVRKARTENTEQLREWVCKWRDTETERLVTADRDPSGVTDLAETLLVITEGCATVDNVRGKIERLFTDDAPSSRRIVLSSTHKFKGLERERVWLLRSTYARPRVGRDGTEYSPKQEENNLLYVGISRARTILNLVWEESE